MKVYTLNILLNTSNRTFGQSEQILTKKVRANGFKIVGDGRAYEFWTGDADGGAFKNKKSTALYPINCTIIESIEE